MSLSSRSRSPGRRPAPRRAARAAPSEDHGEWRRFPGARGWGELGVPQVRLGGDKYLSVGIFRKIRAGSISFYLHVQDFDVNFAMDTVLSSFKERFPRVPDDEIFISYGTANLLDNEIAVYPAEPVSGRQRGVLICGSRGDLGTRGA